MKKWIFLSFLLACPSAFSMWNEYGVIPSTFEVELNAYGAFYRSAYHDGDDRSLSDKESQLNLVPTVRIRPVKGLEFNFSYPIRDDGLKNST